MHCLRCMVPVKYSSASQTACSSGSPEAPASIPSRKARVAALRRAPPPRATSTACRCAQRTSTAHRCVHDLRAARPRARRTAGTVHRARSYAHIGTVNRRAGPGPRLGHSTPRSPVHGARRYAHTGTADRALHGGHRPRAPCTAPALRAFPACASGRQTRWGWVKPRIISACLEWAGSIGCARGAGIRVPSSRGGGARGQCSP
jgi:hypothetical protein